MRTLTAREIGEYDSRDFWGVDEWKRMKTHLDQLLGFRKTIKSKPTQEQLEQLEANMGWIDWYNSILFHSARLQMSDRCDCRCCGKKRTEANTK